VQLTADRRDQLIDSLARRVDSWGLATPVVALLETHKPLSFVASQTLLAFQPLLTMFLRDVPLEEYVVLLEDRKNMERVICRLEELQHELSTSQ
jgi:hypothetical protein